MAACCIVIAILMAQIMATVRRWGIFWGVVRPDVGEDADTLVMRVRHWLAQPRVKAAVFAFAAVEMVALGSWSYVVHGSHLYRLGDVAVSRLAGVNVVYAGVCDRHGHTNFVRLVIDQRPKTLHRKVSGGVSQPG